MSRFGGNIVFNVLGSAWIGVLTLIATPIQVRFLGVEAYSFIGLITVLQVLLSTFDFGLSATVTRLVSSDSSRDREGIAAALNTAASCYWVMAITITALLWINTDWITRYWVHESRLDAGTVQFAMRAMALYLGFRWPVAFYSGLLNGLQRMDASNLIKAGVQTLRLLGGIVVLYLRPDLLSFLTWFAVSSAIELGAYAVISARLCPVLRRRPRFDAGSLRDVWRYSAAMNGVAILSLILSQADRLMVSRLLTLEQVGYYSIAYGSSVGISLIQSAINTASFPSFASACSQNDDGGRTLVSRYCKSSELMGIAVAMPCFLLIFLGSTVLSLWIDDMVAQHAAVAMAWLAAGFFLNAMVSSAYVAAIACGHPGLPLIVNLPAMVAYLPALYFLVGAYGIAGAGVAYATLNAYYLVSLLPVVHARVIGTPVWRWWRLSMLPAVVAGVLSFGSARVIVAGMPPGLPVLATIAAAAGVYLLVAWWLSSPAIRGDAYRMLRKLSLSASD